MTMPWTEQPVTLPSGATFGGTPETTRTLITGQVRANATPATPTPPATPALDSDQRSALDIVNQTLAQYGLASLGNWAWQQIVSGASSSQVLLDLYQRPEFKAAFPEIDLRQQKGLAPISPGDIINYRQAASQYMREAGLPPGFWDSPTDFTKLIGDDVSIDELKQRVDLAKQATYQMPQEFRDIMARDYGITDGHLTANFLDDTQALPIAQKQFLAAQIGATAQVAGYQTNRTQNERLVDMGVSQAQAQQGFSQLANSQELFNSLPGEHTTGISQEDQLNAVFGGNAQAQQTLQRRAQQREAVFQAGGSVAAGQAGYTGAGQARGA